MKTKDYRFTLLYVIGIILVVDGHMGNYSVNFFNNWFPRYAYHLALFMFGSGYFYDKTSSEQDLRNYILKKIKNLLLPLYLWNLFYAVFVLLTSKFGFTIGTPVNWETILLKPIYDGHQFEYNMGGWFIIPLFMVQIYHALLRSIISRRFKRKNEIILFGLNLATGMFGIYLASKGLHTGLWLVLVRMLYFLPFYSLGILYKSTLEKWDKKIPHFWYFLFLFGVQQIIITVHGKSPSYTPSWCNNFNDGLLLPFIAGTLGIALCFRIAVILEPVIGKSKIVNCLADNAYSIMINQFMGAMMIKFIFCFIQSQTNYCDDFSRDEFKNKIWYHYVPGGITRFFLVYVLAGLVVPIAIQKIMNLIWKKIQLISVLTRKAKNHISK